MSEYVVVFFVSVWVHYSNSKGCKFAIIQSIKRDTDNKTSNYMCVVKYKRDVVKLLEISTYELCRIKKNWILFSSSQQKREKCVHLKPSDLLVLGLWKFY